VPDIRYAVRSLLRSRWFAAAAVFTFALGIGVNLAIFCAIDRLLFRQLPYGDVDRLVLLRSCGPDGECAGGFPSIVAFEARERLTSITGIAVAGIPGAIIVDPDQPPIRLSGVSANLLRVLEVQPVLGRDFTDQDAAEKRRVAMLGYDTWIRRFNASPQVVGQALGPGANAPTIVGVLPPGFIPPTWSFVDPAWDGLVLDAIGWADIGRSGMVAVPIVRLAPGISLQSIREEIGVLVSGLASELQGRDGRLPIIRVDPVQRALFSRFRSNALLILAASVVLLLLACANLAGLLLARGRSREYDAAVHASLGASPRRLMLNAVAESLLVCAIGSAVAIAVVSTTSRILAAVLPPLLARYAASATDVRVVGVTLVVAIACALASAVTPAWRLSRVDPISVLQRASGSRQRSRLRGGRSLIVIESALAVLLVTSGLLLVRSFANFAGESLGFDPVNVHAVTVRPAARAKLTPAAALAAYERTLDALRNAPGILAVGGADVTVVSGQAPMMGISKTNVPRGGRYQASEGYFDTLKARFLAGRAFTADEVRARREVAILSASAARHYFPQLTPAQVNGRPLAIDDEAPRAIVGVVGDLKSYGYGRPAETAIFLPLGAQRSAYGRAIIRTHSHAPPQRGLLQQRLSEALGPVTVDISPLTTGLEPALKDPRFRAALFSVLAGAALLLAAIGLYALASFDVSQRQHEMGVRLALGARGRDIGRMIVADACRPVAAGILLGLGAAFWAERVLASFLYGVEPRDPLGYAVVTGILLLTTIAAAWLPARRAVRTDPIAVLRRA
jgi:predicted permease